MIDYVACIYYRRYLTHGSLELNKLSFKNFPIGRELAKQDIIIILGDSGICWDNSKTDKYWQDWLEDRPFTVLSVLGNHCNYDIIRALPAEEWNGGITRVVRPHVRYLENGEIFNIGNFSFFTLGGATSTDKAYRTEGKSYWSAEMPSRAELEHAVDNLEAHDMKVDYILTHCAPNSVINAIDKFYPQYDTLTNFFEKYIVKYVDYRAWLLGHYHLDRIVNNKYHLLYNNFVEIKENGEIIYV